MSIDILQYNTTITLKNICKFLQITNYSGKRKNELIYEIDKRLKLIKLQRVIRKFLSRDELCPISCEPIKYPCFAFKSQTKLIYYNLFTLRNFLIKTGDFRDPSTRVEYNDCQLHTIDSIYENLKYTPTDVPEYFSSVYKASKSPRFYERIREKEQELLIFERVLDTLCDEMLKYITENPRNNQFILTTRYLYEYQVHFNRLMSRSRTHAEYVINKNIQNMIQIYNKETNYDYKQRKSCEYIITHLYQFREELS